MSHYLIVGPPGTGKTTFIKSEIQRLVDVEGYAPEDFMLTSFTRTAAAVLKGRVDVPWQNTATLHSLARRSLGGPPIAEVGDLAKQWNEQTDIPSSWKINSVQNTGKVEEEGTLPNPEEKLSTRFEIYNLARSRCLPDEHPTMRAVADFAARWETFKAETLSMDFTDLIIEASRNTEHAPGDPPVLVADEAQDFVPAQWELIKRWGSAPGIDRFYVAGDPAQTLYAFAGALPDQMLIDVDDERYRQLGQSWRLPLAIKDRAERYLKLHSGPVFDERSYRARSEENGDEITGAVRKIDADWTDRGKVVDDIRKTINDGRTAMVLASCGYMLEPCVSALRTHGIRYHNPYRVTAGQWNPVARRSTARDALTAFLRLTAGTGSLRDSHWTYDELSHIANALRATGPFSARGVRSTFLSSNMTSAKPSEMDDEGVPLYNPFTLAGTSGEPLFSADMLNAMFEGDLGYWLNHVQKPIQRTTDYLISVFRKSGFNALTEEPKTTVGTIHSVKGAEADVVYLIDLISPSMHQDAERSVKGKDAMIRLGYVGMTRAKSDLVICSYDHDNRAKTLGI